MATSPSPAVPSALRLHPWSDGYERARPQHPARRLSDAQRARFHDEGFLLIEDAVDAATVASVRVVLDPLEQAEARALRGREGGRHLMASAGTLHFVYNPAARSPLLRELISSPPFADIAHDLLGPAVRVFWDQAVYKHGDVPREFPVHQDNGYGFVDPQEYLTIWLALGDTGEANGCPRVFPGMHAHGTFVHTWGDDGYGLPMAWRDAAPVPLRSGSLLAFSSLLPHATGPNRTDEPRRAYLAQYTVDHAAYLKGDPMEGPPAQRELVRELSDERQWRLQPPTRGRERLSFRLSTSAPGRTRSVT